MTTELVDDEVDDDGHGGHNTTAEATAAPAAGARN